MIPDLIFAAMFFLVIGLFINAVLSAIGADYDDDDAP
jgi:hypothetical protein